MLIEKKLKKFFLLFEGILNYNLIKSLIFLCLYLIVFFYYRSNLELGPENDEILYQLNNYFIDYVLKGDFRPEIWQDWRAFDQNLLPGYYHGAVLKLVAPYDLNHYRQEYYSVGKKLGPENWEGIIGNDWGKLAIVSPIFYQTIKTVRQINIIFSPFIVIIYFYIATKVKNLWFALIFVYFMLHHYIFLRFSIVVRNDWILELFLALSLLTLILWKNQIKQKNFCLFSLMLGATSGLSFAAKLNGAVSFILFLFISSIFWLHQLCFYPTDRIILSKRIVKGIFLVLLSGFLIFYILHPSIWHDPVSGINKYVYQRQKIYRLHQQIFPESALYSLNDKVSAIAKESFSMNLIGGKIEQRGKFYWFSFCLFIIGFIFSIKDLFLELRGKSFSDLALVFFWFVGLLTIVFIYLPLDWWQYFYILIPSVLFFVSYGLFGLLNVGLGFIRRTVVYEKKI